MDNYKRDLNYGKDSFLEFDLKASKWKHRIQKKGGRRCTPLFPLEFWKNGAQGPHQFEGEDLDFYALRTQELQKSKKGSFQYERLEGDLEKMPAHDECLGGENARDWLEVKKTIDESKTAMREAIIAKHELGSFYTIQDYQTLDLSWNSTKNHCNSFVTNWMTSDQETPWKNFLQQEKAAVDSVREYFGYAAPSNELTQKPMVMPPCVREAFLSQMAKDTAFLAENGIMDYYMGLVIKHIPKVDENIGLEAEPQTECGVAHQDGGRRVSVFEQYAGGICAVSARRPSARCSPSRS